MGIRRTKVPSIPEPTKENILKVVQALKEITEVAEMRRGDKLDAKVTYRDLIDGGLADVNVGAGGDARARGLSDPSDRTTPGPNSPFLKPPSFDGLVLPGRPANVHTFAVWDGIQIIWDWPEAQGATTYWKRAVVWASATPDFDSASIVGFSTQNLFTHTGIGLSSPIESEEVSPGVRYYWVQFEGLYDEAAGATARTETNPYEWEDGIRGSTAIDPAYALSILEGSITEHALNLDLQARIDLVDYDPENPNGPRITDSVQQRILSVSGDVDGVYAAIAETARTAVNPDDGYLEGEYSIRLDLDGYISGFGLSAFSEINKDTGERETSSAFIINADIFAVGKKIPYDPNKPAGTTGKKLTGYPFMVGDIDGVPTVGINGQLIVDGTIYAQAIQAGQIGTAQLNAIEVYTDLLDAENIITGTFSTRAKDYMRLEINGEGSKDETYPFWYGRGDTGGEDSVFYANRNGSMFLAGDLYVTGVGRFFAGNLESGEYRIEIGGPADDYLLWAGTGTKNNTNSVFYIDNGGNAKFKGLLEAKYVSGEISRQTPIDDKEEIAGKKSLAMQPYGVKGVQPNEWTELGRWTLGPSQFQEHLPTCTISFNTYGTGVRAGAYRILYKVGSGGWTELYRAFISMLRYGTDTTTSVTAPEKTLLTTHFRLEFAGADGNYWEQGGEGPIYSSRRNGYLLGLR